MDFIEFSRSEILILSNIIRLVRKETGLPLKMQSENFLKRLDTAMVACKNQKTHQLYQEFIDNFSDPGILAQLNIADKASSNKTLYRGRTTQQEKTSDANTENNTSSDTPIPKGKRKIVYRGQVKYVDK